MKVFISHKKDDEKVALSVKLVLESCNVEAYLDLLDDEISGSGEKLTEHIRAQLGVCSDTIVILSRNTRESWWVPFEIGMSTERDMPIANYLVSNVELPDYLEFWPRLKNTEDLKEYVKTRKEVHDEYNSFMYILESAQGHIKESETMAFYRKLKQRIKK